MPTVDRGQFSVRYSCRVGRAGGRMARHLPRMRDAMNWGGPGEKACKRTAPHTIAEPKHNVFRRPIPSVNSGENGKDYIYFQRAGRGTITTT
jgi:hypothetical protein